MQQRPLQSHFGGYGVTCNRGGCSFRTAVLGPQFFVTLPLGHIYNVDDNQSVRTECELFIVKNNSGVLNWTAKLTLASRSLSSSL